MTPEQFCYWLQGMLEVSNPSHLDEIHTKAIKEHLALVFNKVIPNYKPNFSPVFLKPCEVLDKIPLFDKVTPVVPFPFNGPYC